MPDTRYPFQMAGGVPVVTAPAEIDLTNAGRLQAILAEWHARGHATVAVDLTGTRFCDSAGLRVLVRAHQRAVGDGGGLRLVIPADGPVAQIFTVTGLAGVIPASPAWTRPWRRYPPPQPGPVAKTVPGNRQQHRPACPHRAESLAWRGRAAAVRSAAQCSCRSVSTPGSALLAAGPPGTGSIAVPRLSGAPGRPHHRGNFRPDRDLPRGYRHQRSHD